MDRRTVLKSGSAVVGLLALSGCTEAALEAAESPPPFLDDRYHEEEFDLPVNRKFDVLAAAVERADGEAFGDLDESEAYLTDEGVAVERLEEHVEEGELVGSLSHAPATTDRVGSEETTRGGDGLVETVGVVAGGYAALVRGDHDVEELTVEVVEPDGRPFGEYEVFTTWAEEYDAGALSAAKYGGEVLHQLKSVRG